MTELSKELEGSIAVVGMSGRFPGAADLEAFWRNLRDGVDSVRVFSEDELRAYGVDPKLIADPFYVKAAAQPPGLDEFDAGFFGINHREAELLDPQQRLFLELCWEALEDAGYDSERLGVTGVFAGQTTSTYLLFNLIGNPVLMESSDPLQLLVGNAGDSLATRVSYKLNLKGPSYTIQSACSTSAVAVHAACQSLLNTECDVALAGGVSINTQLLTGYRAAEGSVFSRSGKCRAFDAGAEGILFGGGGGVVVLKRLEDALAEGDNVHAVVLGSAVNNDGALKVGYTAPSVEGQAEVISEALGVAGVTAESLSYLEAHGTGTRLGDPIEIQALTKAFASKRKQLIPLGSVKTNVGHLDVAAGIAGLLKTVLALKHGQIPPSLHFERPNPEIDFASSPVYVNTELRQWERNGSPRRAGVSSFGFGGTNAHLILQEAPEIPRTLSDRERFFLPVSARSEEALERACQRLADHLENHPELDLADVEYTLRVGRRAFEHRRTVECRTREEAIEALRAGSAGVPPALSSVGRRVSLPTYPFERRRYWIDHPGLPVPQVAIAAARSFHPRPNLFTPYEPPRDEREEKVCQLWQEILGVEPVGIRDDFFQLGGHSLLATQILSRVRDVFAVDFPLAHLFSFPTAAELAEAIGFLQEEAEERPRIGRSSLRETNGPFPLSFSQQRLWLIDQLEPGNPLYNELRAVRIWGPLQIPVLERSLQELVNRHEALRTTFHLLGEEPVQVVQPRVDLPLAVLDLSALSAAVREAEVLRLAMAEARSSFDFSGGPLARARLLKLEPDEHLLLFNVHHIASDGWSMALVIRESMALYDAFSRGLPSPLPELPLQYADFAHWQREWLQGEVLEAQLAYWREAMAGAPSVLELPTDRPRPPVQSPGGGNEPFKVSRVVTAALANLAQSQGATLFMVLLAAFQALLHRLSGQEDLLVGSPIANRNRPEIEGLIGFFVNTLVLRGRPVPEMSFRELLSQASTVALGAFAHQDLPFEHLVDELRIEHSASHSPLFQAMLALHNVPSESLALPGLTVIPWEVHGGMSRFELILSLTEVDGGLQGGLEYRKQLFDAVTARRLTRRFQMLLAAAASAPDLRLSDLPLLTAAEEQQLLFEWNDAGVRYPGACLHELIAAQVERTPDATAVVFESESLTYRELWDRAASLAGYLRALGVGPEERVGVCAERSTELVTGLLSVLVAGGAYVPIDPDYPRERVAFMLEDSAVPVLLTQRHLADRLPPHGAQTVLLDAPLPSLPTLPSLHMDPDFAAYAIYTSGSTGRPKGAVNTHRGIVNRLLWMQEMYGLTPQDRVLQKTPFSFDVSVWELFWPLLTGARLVVARPGGHQDGAYLVRTIAEQGITTIHFVPSMLRVFLEEPDVERCGSLLRVICSGEALPFALQQRFQALLPAELHNLYGPTEAAVDVTWWTCERGAAGPTVPIGWPVANTRIHLLDRAFHPVPQGVPGELCIGGVQVARGYLGRPELTAERFVPDPHGEAGVRMYRTGDLARHLPSGAVEYLGRLDHQVKVRGLRIELGEIESAVNEHPGVSDCVVLARDEASGEKQLVAYLVPTAPGAIDESTLRAALAARLPEYMVPSAFVFLGEMPLSPNGKVDRKALARITPEPAAAAGPIALPRTRREELLAAIWAGVLGVERVGVHDNFFKLGGDSILSIQVAARARRAGLVITPKQLFERPTVAELAEAAQAARIEAEQGPVMGPAPLTPIQHVFFEHDTADPHHFNQSIFLDVLGGLAWAPLAGALAALLAHHDALRLRFARENGEWTQRHDPPGGEVPLTRIDLSALPQERRREAMLSAAAGLQAGLDLARGPLMRAGWFHAETPGDRLQIAIHHLPVDGVSWQVLVEDLETAYGQLAVGGEVDLPPKTVSWKRWAELLGWHARSGALRDELAYWLSLRHEVAPLPMDLPGGEDTVARSAMVSVQLTEEETRALLQKVPAVCRAQIQDLLLAALAWTVARWTGHGRVWLDLEGHGREELVEGLDVSRTVGWFTALFPVGLDLPASATPALAVRAVKERLRSMPNRGVGFGLLRWLSGDPETAATLAALPRREILFNYLGRLDAATSGAVLFAPASEFPPGTRSPRGRRWYRLEVDAMVLGDRLRVVWTYGADVHRAATIQALADGLAVALRELIAAPEAVGYSVSDFPLARLDPAALDALEWANRDIEDLYPLSPVQQGMLFHSLYSPGAPGADPYVLQISGSLHGWLDDDAFLRAWQEVVDHHPALRTAFLWSGLEEPLQAVRSRVQLQWTREDWSGLPESERQGRLREFLEVDRGRGFDLGRAPLLRMALLRTGDEEHWLVWTSHHLLLDGWCFPIVFGDFVSLFEAHLQGKAAALPRRRPYRDFLAWLARQDPARSESFWRQALDDFTAPTPLPFDRPWTSTETDDVWSMETARVPAAVTAALERLAHDLGVTLSTVVQGAWALLLACTSGERDVVFGTVLAGRPAELEDAESMVGMFVNSLPLRVDADPQVELGPWLLGVQQRLLDLRQHEWTPLVSVQSWSGGPAGQPLFHSLFAFQNYPVERSLGERLGGLAVRNFVFNQRTHYPLSAAATPGEELRLDVDYDRHFDATTVRRLISQLGVLLAGAAAHPAQPVSELPLLGESERHQVALEWNDTPGALEAFASAPARIAAQAERTPDAPAVAGAGEDLTYRELARRGRCLANHLRSLGVGPEVRVGLLAERTPELAVGILGILGAGGAFVPLDPFHPEERLAFVMEDAVLGQDVRIVVATPGAAAAGAFKVVSTRDGTDERALPEPAPENLAYVLYTSGTTGRPKGVLVEHRNLAHTLAACGSFGFSPGERVPALAPSTFDIFLFELLPPLLTGGRVELIPLRPALEIAGLAAELPSSTRLHGVPALMRQITERVRMDSPAGIVSLREVYTGGDAVPPDVLEDLRAAFPEARVRVLYGPTEATIICASLDASRGASVQLIGRPLPGSILSIRDPLGSPLGVGIPGEIWLQGPSITRGYLGRPDLTAERFVPAAGGERWYRTGDRARTLPDGTLEFLGRTDRQVKIRGVRVEPGEVEAALARQPGIREAAVLARETTAGDRRLIAYLVGTPDVDAVRAQLARELPEVMIPAAFVVLQELPLTPHGKVDRRALPEPESNEDKDRIAPTTETEHAMAEIWAALLGIEQVGIEEDFFALGGHSLIATRVASRIKQRLGVEIPLRLLFEARTIAALAARIDELRAPEAREEPPLLALEAVEAPLSFAQERLWFLDRLQPESSLYNVPAVLRLAGKPHVGALRRTFTEIVRRHAPLRTTFTEIDGEPRQVIAAPAPVPLPVIDLAGLPATIRDREAARQTAREVDRPFDLARGPLLRLHLLRYGQDDHSLIVNIHHIASDGWSIGILIHETTVLYEAFVEGLPSPLPELPIQYADFAVWQRQWLSGPVLEEQLAYWRRELDGAPALIELPADRPRPPAPTYRGATLSLPLPAAAAAAVYALAAKTDATPFMVLLTAFQALVHRYTGSIDVLVGSPIANRTRMEIEGLIGLFVNTLVFRLRLREDDGFLAALERVRATTVAGYAHQDLPFELLVDSLGVERSLAHNPLFQALLALQNAELGELRAPGFKITQAEWPATTAKFDLSLTFNETAAGFTATLEYATDLFDAATMRRLLVHYGNLLAGAGEDPARRLDEISLLSDAERQQILVWNDTAVDFGPACLHELVAAQAERTPDAVAVVFEDQELTYRALERRAGSLARHLRDLGAGPETLVGIAADRSLELVVGLLAILQAGSAYVPLDPGYPAERLAAMLEDAAVPVLLTQSHLVDRLPAHGAQPVLLDRVKDGKDGKDSKDVDPDFAAYAIFTSGSTGRPKAAVNTHRGIVNRLLWMQQAYGLTADDRVLQKTPFSFDVSVWEFFWPLITGARLVVARPGGHQDPAYLADTIERAGITTVHFVPSMLQVFVEQEGLERLRSLRRVIASGEALPAELAERFHARLGAELHNLYGPTEAAVDVTYHACRPGEERVPIGRPVANTRIHLLDSAGREAPAGVPGELCIGGVQVGRGYLGRADLTAERFVPDRFGPPGSRLYRTGDLARFLTDGEVEYLGRLDHQVKIRGFRVELGEIEAALTRHPEVREAVVMARGEGADRSLIAYLVPPVPEGDATLREHLRACLPEHMAPAAFVFLEAMPLSPSGKVDRKALAKVEPQRAGTTRTAPRTPTEERLAAIWAGLLGVEQIGVEDHFFHLGGHSLMATRLVSRLRSSFAVELPLRSVFEMPTLGALAEWIEAAPRERTQDRPAPRTDRVTEPPLSFPQERLWFLDQLEPDSPLYNIPTAIRLRGELDGRALERSFQEVVRRHEALRTTFPAKNGKAVQRIAPSVDLSVPVIDLAALESKEAELRRLAAVEAALPFDLWTGPLLRVLRVRLADQEHTILCTLHHIVGDAWSLNVLVREVGLLYAAFHDGEASPLPELPIQFADFAIWQREQLQEERLEAELAWWRDELVGAPTVLDLPADRPRPAMWTSRGETVPLTAIATVGDSLNALCHREQATPFMALIAAFQALLHRMTGSEDFLLGVPIAGRTHGELEGLIGFFVNTLPVRGRPAGGASFREALAQARTTALGVFAHQHIPFEKLVEELGVERSLAYPPLVQTAFALQNAPAAALELPGLTVTPLAPELSTTKFELVLGLFEDESGLGGSVEYSSDLFDRSTILRLIGHFRVLLEAALADPACKLDELPLLEDSARHQLLGEWNDQRSLYPERSVPELFEEQAALRPKAVAAVFGEERLTYAELDRRANRLANHLGKLGVRLGTPVAIFLERSAEMVVATLAVLKAGGAYVPLDASYPEERLAFMLEDVGAKALITREESLGLFPGVETLCVDRDTPILLRESEERPAATIPAEALAYVIYTSGSTGKPKGVAVPHRAIVRLVRNTNYVALGPDDAIAQASNTSFDAATFEIWGALLNGGRLTGITKETMLAPAALAAQIRRDGLTVLFLTTALFNQVSREAPYAFAPLRTVLFGGELVDPAQVRALLHGGPPQRLLHVYGPTESTTYASWYHVESVPESAATVPIGQPLANTSLLVLDHSFQPVPAGWTGELYVGGEGLAWGYINRPELTAERFVPDPFGCGERLYRTGDLVRRRDGAIEFLGRADFQVKIRGFRIELGEVEAALLALPEIAEAIVLALGEGGDKRLVAYVSPHPGRTLRDRDVREALAARLPTFMVPSAIVVLDALPLNPNGKVDRKALARIELPAAEEREVVAPRTPTEEILTGIFGELLGISRVGAEDPFFDLGGHSLLATRLASRVRETFGVELPLREVFEAPTPAGLAGRIEAARLRASGLATPPIVPALGEDRFRARLSFAQERLWFLDHLEPGSAFYNVPFAFRISGPLDPPVLAEALNEIVRRHDSLRTTFVELAGEPWQLVLSDLSVPLPVLDLSALPADLRQIEAGRCLRREAAQPFDLSRGPLLRALLLRLAPESWMGILTMHHIISDGWSIEVLARELAGRPTAQLPIQYADFARWQRDWLKDEVLDSQIALWKETLRGARTVLELPADRPRPPIQTFRGASRPLALPAKLTSALRNLGRKQGVTLFMALLAGFEALLARYTQEADFLVGSPVANRNRAETEGLIGFFVNNLVLRADLSADPDFALVLERVRANALAAYERQDLPFERLVEQMDVERSLARNPLFQVVFSLQNAPAARFELPGLTLAPIDLEATTAKTDLLLAISESGEELRGVWEYATDLFDGTRIERMSAHLLALLEAAAADPSIRLADLPLLTMPERHQLRWDWNEAAGGKPTLPVCLPELFAERVAEAPDHPAMIFGEETISYGELARRAGRLAHHLAALGVAPEIRVGIAAEPGIDRIAAVLAVWLAGGAYVPLDASYPQERLAFMLEDAAVPVLLTQSPLLDRLPAHGAQVVLLDTSLPSLPSLSSLPPNPDQAAYVIYTSGSTGRPNGVLVRHGSAARLIQEAIRHFNVSPESRILQSISFSFDASVLETWMALASGATLVIAPREALLSGDDLAETIDRHGITTAVLTPAVLANLPLDGVPTLETASVGGDSCPGELATRWASRLRLLNCYGPTEATIYATVLRLTGAFVKEPPIGRPVGGTEVHLLDRSGRPVPAGVPGELCLGGQGLARGYLNRPDLTAQRFFPHPSLPGERLYRTGDLAIHRSDGTLEFLGRIDHQVKVRGLRIELGEVEAALARHPAVRECAVAVRGAAGGGNRLLAWVVLRESVPAAHLRTFLRERLPEHMVPADCVSLDALPLSPTGKVDRAALPLPEAAAADRIAPRDTLEHELARIWEEVLGTGPIGVRDDFFALGGHSLLAVRLTSAIEAQLGRKLPLTALFTAGTVEAMAALLREGSVPEPASNLIPLQPKGSRPPFFWVHPAGGDVLCYAALARHLGDDQPFYGIQTLGEEPPSSIEEMAAHYLQEVRRVQPEGPYFLGGWSLGGQIAFEMARQLRSSGETLGLLAILDGAPFVDDAGDEETDADLLFDVAAYVGSLWGRDPGVTRERLAELSPDEQIAWMAERLAAVDFLPPGTGEAQLRRVLAVYRANTRAARRYQPGFFPDGLTLLRAEERPLLSGIRGQVDLGWRRFAGGPVEIHVVPGHHLSLLAEPNVRALASLLRLCLESAHEPVLEALD